MINDTLSDMDQCPVIIRDPLTIPEILEQILEYPSFDDLKSCRLVSKVWCAEATLKIKQKCGVVKFHERGPASAVESCKRLISSIKNLAKHGERQLFSRIELTLTWSFEGRWNNLLSSLILHHSWIKEMTIIYNFYCRLQTKHFKILDLVAVPKLPFLQSLKTLCTENIWHPMTDAETKDVGDFITTVLYNANCLKSLTYQGDSETMHILMKTFADENRIRYQRLYVAKDIYYPPDEIRFADYC